MNLPEEHGSTVGTWILIAAMLGIIFFKGLFSFIVVADKGQPDWDYRPVRDVPAQSEYATYQLLPHPQHIRGDKGK